LREGAYWSFLYGSSFLSSSRVAVTGSTWSKRKADR
jgi:hypothetical protein